MTQRERFLAMAIGGLLVVVGLQWMFTQYKNAKQDRITKIANLQKTSMDLNTRLLEGAMAERQMGEYRVRSLPGDREIAVARYSSYLLDLVKETGINTPDVRHVNSTPMKDLYTRHRFSVGGSADLPTVIRLLHSFYATDYLHRIADLTIKPSRTGDLRVTMAVDAIGLSTVPAEATVSEAPSWRVDPDMTAYESAILNRNFFEPPNKAPRFGGDSQIEGIVGRRSTARVNFADEEDHPIEYELGEDAPDFVELDAQSGTLSFEPKETGEFEVLVRATDKGYPAQTTEQLVKIRVNEPPVEKEPEPEPKFDHASQTVLTALVQGRDDWTAWMNVRTSGKTLKLRVGDRFEIGTVTGEVAEVNRKYVVLEIDGQRVVLSPGKDTLRDVAQRAKEDD
ncbi:MULTISPECIES: cadherin repeat domain-containing protein [Crateriforma]|uniref:Cadherin domain-containing protein n=1 Tax=Crateriforma conspicua TaxID=2527996 RepID=A0A5C6FRN1_9PLAN|nr:MULTISPECIES: cadherin repeat domain-containing protein [Crateriforma]TWU65747.1 hypothetical protein V7x_12960 [Crateriforma conspicua]